MSVDLTEREVAGRCWLRLEGLRPLCRLLKLRETNLLKHLFIAVGCASLIGCGSAVTREQRADADVVPEITLNLPTETACQCLPTAESDAKDHTFLERGIENLSRGEHIEAIKAFQRYQRLEKTELAAWETGIAIAFTSTLPNSPFYDAESSRATYARLKKSYRKEFKVHQSVLLMRDALEMFVAMLDQTEELERANAALAEDLEKREKALKRLRDLTLGAREESL